MSIATFDQLFVLLGPSRTFQDTNMRKSVPPEERLVVALRYKATLFSFFIKSDYSCVNYSFI
jgi:hypothetical protein